MSRQFGGYKRSRTHLGYSANNLFTGDVKITGSLNVSGATDICDVGVSKIRKCIDGNPDVGMF